MAPTMRTSSSRHEVPLGQQADGILRSLNAGLLLHLLQTAPVISPQPVDKGKKRARSPTGSAGDEPLAKRAKSNSDATTLQANRLPLLRHDWELRYRLGSSTERTGGSEDSDAESVVIVGDGPNGLSSIREEDDLKEWLTRLGHAEEDGQDVDLGTFHLVEHSSRYFLAIEPPLAQSNGRASKIFNPALQASTSLLELPPLPHNPSNFLSVPHGLATCAELARLNRVRVTAVVSATLSTHSHSGGSASTEGLLPFILRITLQVELLLPLWNGHGSSTTKGQAALLHEAQSHLITYFFPPSALQHRDAEADIPFFYSSLGPAPLLPNSITEEAVQPGDLLPILLPFQRRSVGWLLDREGKAMSADGKVVPKVHDEATLPLFWARAEAPNGTTVYVNRVTLAVSLEKPPQDRILGGILAEEPGLGKTLEAIALILLNPAVGRNPTTKRWDVDSKVYVKEIKTTLIVTPAALAPQWADEIRAHAPTLKVLIYDGWSKVKVPITEDDADEERESKKMAKTKAKAKGKRKARANSKANTSAGTDANLAGPSTSTGKEAANEDFAMDVDSDTEDGDNEDEVLDWCGYVQTFDVCITTYNVLQQDLGVARAPPTRPRRNIAQYSNVERPRSPLVMCEWYRVIMDEVQMVGGGKTEEMVSLIPRSASFAVSGTPARAQVADLVHVLKFLRVESVISTPRLWARLLSPRYSEQFKQLFQTYAVRTMKATVKEELTIPQQTRYLVPVALGSVERQVYDETVERALNELGLDARGVAASDGWEIDSALLRSWLRRLRGIATHPQVGQLLNPADKLNKTGVIKSIHELLEGMCDQNWRNMMDDRKKKVESLTQSAQLQQHDQANPRRYQSALDILLLAEREANHIVVDIAAVITQHDARGEELKREAAALREAREQAVEPADGREDTGKGKNRVTSADRENSLEADPSLDPDDGTLHGLPKTPAGAEHATKRRALIQRMRECNLVLHRVKFLQGDVYHVLGAAHSDAENEAYATAERLRRDLLKYTESAALRAMERLARESIGRASEKSQVSEKTLLVELPYCDQGGLRSSDLMDQANEIIEELLNPQTALLWEWRRRIYDLLTEKISGDQDATGGEYAQSLETQGQAEVLLQAYAALMADRREVLVAERTTLAAQHDVRAKPKGRKTKAAGKAQAALEAMLLDAPEGIAELPQLAPLEPEHQVLAQELADERRKLMEEFNGRAVKSVMVQLSEILVRITKDKDPERDIIKDACHKLRMLINNQNTLMDALENDLARLRRAFNERILYFRQLQEISDSVVDAEWEGELRLAIHEGLTEQAALDNRINSSRARQRYLENLAQGKQTGAVPNSSDEDDVCILCHCEFYRGYLTQCAHAFCEGCMKAFLGRKDGKACPVCRVAINVDQLQRFSIGEKTEADAPPKVLNANGELVPKSRRHIEYNIITPDVMDEIKSMEVYGSYGSKIESIVRHLLYVQHKDPGSKSIIFSAWADSLHIVQHALVSNGIPCLRIDQGSRGKEHAAKRFRTDPGILVLLLHGERENAGLNVTCASRVFLVESVVNHAFETQAIARVDRMGQKRPTEVYCYYAEDTVERNILDLAARHGMSLYTKDNSAGTLTANTISDSQTELSSPAKKMPKQKGDFIFSTDDMLAILFPHMDEDIEFLVPDELPVVTGDTRQHNAEAGPSRPRM